MRIRRQVTSTPAKQEDSRLSRELPAVRSSLGQDSEEVKAAITVQRHFRVNPKPSVCKAKASFRLLVQGAYKARRKVDKKKSEADPMLSVARIGDVEGLVCICSGGTALAGTTLGFGSDHVEQGSQLLSVAERPVHIYEGGGSKAFRKV